MNASEARPVVELAPELQKLLDGAGARPPVVIDQRTQETYVLVPVAVYERLTRNQMPPPPKPKAIEIPEGIKQARAAFIRDFPELWTNRKTRWRYVCYRKDERVAVVEDYASAIREVNRLAIPEEEFWIFKVGPRADEDEQRIAAENVLEIRLRTSP